MTEHKKPETKEEILNDIANHPERGKINGQDVINTSRREIRGTVAAETKRKLLRIAACYGANMGEILTMAIAALWERERINVEKHEQEKADAFGVDVKQVQRKSYGHYKAKGREKKANLGGENE